MRILNGKRMRLVGLLLSSYANKRLTMGAGCMYFSNVNVKTGFLVDLSGKGLLT